MLKKACGSVLSLHFKVQFRSRKAGFRKPCNIRKVENYLPLIFHRQASGEAKKISSVDANFRVIFIGSDEFSLPSLVAVEKAFEKQQVTVVVSSYKNSVGKFARINEFKTVLWEDLKEDAKKLELLGQWFGDVGIVASFGALIPARVINRFRL